MQIIEKDLINKTVAVALSGGADSMALISYLKNNLQRLTINLKAVNVEHGIRGGESEKDSDFVKAFCDRNNIECFSYKVNSIAYAKKEAYGLEQAARILRYNCFNDLLDSGKVDYIATAHHKSDNVETVLFNLFRGASLNGVSGINYINGKIIRPLIETEKYEIENYIKDNGIEFVTDSTNSDTAYSRNYIRHKIMPVIKDAFPTAENAVSRFAKLAKEDDDYLTKIAEKLVKFDKNSIKIEFCNEKPIFFRAVISAFAFLKVDRDYTLKHLESVYNLQNQKSGSGVDLIKKVRAVNNYNFIELYIKEETTDFQESEFKEGVFVFNNIKMKIERVEKQNCDGLYFDGEKLPQNSVIRRRKNGDVFTKFGGGSKKLKDFLIDKKIPQHKRDDILLIAKGNEIYLIAGVEISDKIKVDKNSKMIYNVTITTREK